MKVFSFLYSYFKNIFFIFLFLVFSTQTYAAATYSCAGEDILNIHGTIVDANTAYSEDSTGANMARYFKFTPNIGGEMIISYGQNGVLAQEKQTLLIGTTCDGSDIYSQINGEDNDNATFYTIAGTTYYIRIKEENPSDILRFTADFNFKALEIGFEQAQYNISEDINLGDGATQVLELKLILSHPVNFALAVSYASSDGTATDINDYVTLIGTIIFAAGEIEKTIAINIIRDVIVELEENLFVSITNIVPDNINYNNVVTVGDYSPTEILILEQLTTPVCFEDDFNNALDDDWRLLFSSGGFTPGIVNDKLRMTNAVNTLSTAVTKDFEFIADGNLIVVEFDQFAYGRTDTWSVDGADGIGVVLYDSSIGASPMPGAFGGSLGYAQRTIPTNDDGFEGGWLGLALDEFGNYANPNEGRVGGIGFTRNAVSIRGDGNGMVGYEYLAGSGSLTPRLAQDGAAEYSGGRFRMIIDSRDTAHLYITLERDADRDGTYEAVIINKFDAKDPVHNQGTTPTYVRLAITSSTGGANNIHEIDNLIVYGVCRPYAITPPSGVVSKADIVNNFIDSNTYNNGTKYITTKVTKKTEEITGVYLNSSNFSATYSSVDSNLKFKIIPYLSDSTCTTQETIYDTAGNPAIIDISNGEASAVIDVIMPDTASKDSRFLITALDLNKVYNDTGQACILNSSTTGNLQGIGQCVNSQGQYELAFGTEAVQRCYTNGVNGTPCRSNNGGKSCGLEQLGELTEAEELACGYNALYDNDYGCLMCTLDANQTCASDNFAIRPNEFSISSSDTNYPDLLLSGEDYNVSIFAYDSGITSGNITTNEYSFTNADTNLTITQALLLKDDSPAIGGELNGAFSWGSDSFDMLNGKSTSGVSNEVANVNFNDIGKVILKVIDKSWAAVDTSDVSNVNDATTHDCDGAFICGETNTTFIPHHFTFTNPVIVNSNANPGAFTYIANLDSNDTSTYSTGVRVTVGIEARNKNNNITSNFKVGANYYENPVDVDISFSDINHGDANTTEIDDVLLGFGQDNGDVNGTKSFIFSDTNMSKVLRFNFSRDVNNTLNPFNLNGTDLNITMSSDYVGTAPVGAVTIKDDDSGDATATGSVLMVYGRTYTSTQRYNDNNGSANIYYEVYCFETDTSSILCNPLLLNSISPNLRRVDDIRWYINILNTANDGVAGFVIQKGGTNIDANDIVDATDNPTGNPSETDITYDETSDYPYKTTMENNASSWLIYNEDNINATVNQFQVEFSSQGNWSGERDTFTTTTDNNTTTITNRRSMW